MYRIGGKCVVEALIITNSPSQDYTHPDDLNLPTYDMTPGFNYLQNQASVRDTRYYWRYPILWEIPDTIGDTRYYGDRWSVVDQICTCHVRTCEYAVQQLQTDFKQVSDILVHRFP